LTVAIESSYMATIPRRQLRAGVLAATLTFFREGSADLDIPTIRQHAVRLAQAGLVGLVTMGSNGEAPHLNSQERQIVTRETRAALEAGFEDIPIILGASAASARGTLELCSEAAIAGGDYVLILPPSYFRGAMSPEVLANFYSRVAASSPLPLLLYSFPAVSAGIEMDSDFLISISQHPNVVGTKFTCGDTGKLSRVAQAMNASTPGAVNSGYVCYGGLADFGLMALIAGGSGYVAGGANVVPRACVRVFNLYLQNKIHEAVELQKTLAKGDWYHTKAGIAGTKAVLETYFGYGGIPREPLQPLNDEGARELRRAMEEVMSLEKFIS
jgi:L-threo-3-deoxy-hexylosonate aldolase